jgi:uncharacterized protein YndB with AHSA1/START domain
LRRTPLAKWLPPNGFACTVHQLEAKVGGTFRMSFRNFTTGTGQSFGGEYVDYTDSVVPLRRLECSICGVAALRVDLNRSG